MLYYEIGQRRKRIINKEKKKPIIKRLWNIMK